MTSDPELPADVAERVRADLVALRELDVVAAPEVDPEVIRKMAENGLPDPERE